MTRWIILLISPIFFQCSSERVDYRRLTAFSESGHINAVIEIPAGTNEKIEFDGKTASFEVDQVNDQPRVIQFIPYPGNYGFVPGTKMASDQGGDGDPLDILVIGPHQPTGTVMEVHPIGILLLKDGGEADHKIVALPVDPALKTIDADNFTDFLVEYDAAKKIIEEWFLNYKGFGAMEFIGWENEQYALNEIKKWVVQ